MQPNKPYCFLKSATVEQAEIEGKFINMLLKVSTEKRDKEGDMFLKGAWTHKEDVEYFQKKGVIDWNHLSQTSKFAKSNNPKEKAENELVSAEAIIGVPSGRGLFLGDDGLYCEARINAENKYIKPFVPLLKAGFSGLEVSAAGGAYRPSPETISKYGEKTWDRARLTHIAICPPGEAINDETQALLIKSHLPSELGWKEDEEPIPTKFNIDPVGSVLEYISSSSDYNQWVANRLVGAIDSGLLQKDYQAIFEFVKNHGLSVEKAKQYAIKLLQAMEV